MCYVTHLDCQVCKVKDKFLFQPCEDFRREHVDHARNGPLPPRERFHCPDLTLPLPEGENTSHHICDLCLRNGVIYYQRTVSIEQQNQFNERYHASLYPCVQQLPSTPNIVEVEEDDQELEKETLGYKEEGELMHSDASDEEGDIIITAENEVRIVSPEKRQEATALGETRLFPRSFEIQGRFPPNWEHIGQGFKNFVRDTLCRDQNKEPDPQTSADNEKAREEQWQTRLADEPYRVLTLWFPCCTMCKKPSFNQDGGIDGLEFEPSAMLWKWLKRLQGETTIVTKIKTGFIHKPCEACINKETKLRLEVTQFLSTCSNPAAWGVWQWLTMRGTGWVPFWRHEAPNVGFTDATPWDINDYLDLMTVGWKANSGVAWEDTVDLDPPVSCPVITHLHQEPFLDLSQWNDLAGVPGRRNPTVQLRTLLRDTEGESTQENEDESGQEDEDESGQEDEDESGQENELTPPTTKLPHCPEVPMGQTRTLRQGNAKQQEKSASSFDKHPKREQKRFFTVRGVVHENGRAVNALGRARALASRIEEPRSEQAALNQTPANFLHPVTGNVVEPARMSRKRHASNSIPGREAKRSRPEVGSVDDYPSPPTVRSGGRSSQEPGTPRIPTRKGASSLDALPEGIDDEDLFGNNEINQGAMSSPAVHGAVVRSVDGRSGRSDQVQVNGPTSKNTLEECFCSCGHGFWRVSDLEPKARWGFPLGFLDEEDVES